MRPLHTCPLPTPPAKSFHNAVPAGVRRRNALMRRLRLQRLTTSQLLMPSIWPISCSSSGTGWLQHVSHPTPSKIPSTSPYAAAFQRQYSNGPRASWAGYDSWAALLAGISNTDGSCSSADAWAAAQQAFQLQVLQPTPVHESKLKPSFSGRHDTPTPEDGRRMALLKQQDTQQSDQPPQSFPVKVAAALDVLVLDFFQQQQQDPALLLAALPRVLSVYAALHPPGQAVQSRAAAMLKQSSAWMQPLLSPGMLTADSIAGGPATGKVVSSTVDLLTPEYAILIAQLASAAGAQDRDMWLALGQLVAWHVEVLPPDTLAAALMASATSGHHDLVLFEQAGQYLAPPASSVHSGTGWAGRGSEASSTAADAGAAAALQAMQPSSLAAILHAMALVRHANGRLLKALTNEVSARLSPVERPHLSFAWGAGALPFTPPVPGRGFSLKDLSHIAYACAVLSSQDAALMSSIARESFALLLQFIEAEENRRQQERRQQERQRREQHQKQDQPGWQQQRQRPLQQSQSQQQQQAAAERHQIPARPSAETIVPLVWALSQYGSCQAVMLDAVALLIEPELSGLTPAKTLLLLEACVAVIIATRADAHNGSTDGAEQLVDALACVITSEAKHYSVQQAAQAAMQYAVVSRYNAELLQALCGQLLQGCVYPGSTLVTAAAGRGTVFNLPWGPLVDLVTAVTQLGFRPSSLLEVSSLAISAARGDTVAGQSVAMHGAGMLPGTSLLTGLPDSQSSHHIASVRAPASWHRLTQESWPQQQAAALPPVGRLVSLAWSSASIGRRDTPLLLAAARAASANGSSLRILQLSQLVWALAAAQVHCWDDLTTAGGGAGGSSGGRASLGHLPHPSWVDTNGCEPEVPQQVQDIVGLVLKTPEVARAESNDVLAPHMLLLCQAHILLLVTLPENQRRQLSQLPRDWINTLQYVWEHEQRRRKQERRRAGLLRQQSQQRVGNGDDGGFDVSAAHKQLATALTAACKVPVLTDRCVNVGGFMVDVDATLDIGGHAVAVLLGDANAYARGEHQAPSQHRSPNEEQSVDQLLLGLPVWRQTVLQRLGWVVVRVHWQDWCQATKHGVPGQTKLVRSVIAKQQLLH